MKTEFETVSDFPDWYTGFNVRQGVLYPFGFSQAAATIHSRYQAYKTDHQKRVHTYEKYEKQAAAEVVTKKADLPNISSGESAGFVRRLARNVVQHTPNVFINNEFDDESIQGQLARHMLKTKVIGDDQYSNSMQQNLITTARRGFTIGFDCVIPVLVQDSQKRWYMKYDNIAYRDVFPEPGCKDIRQATEVFVRRYLTRGELQALCKNQTPGWDHAAIRALLATSPMMKEYTDHESKKHSVNTHAYEVITRYTNNGEPFLTWAGSSKYLLRIEKNKHPLKEHPVFFYVPERDDAQPFGKSLLSLTFGRQEFQDLFMNGAMKMFYRNINPPIIGYGNPNALPNLSPGKYTPVSNPNAKFETFEVNSQSLMMFGQISQQNQANMVQMLGAADQQMASQGTGGMMSQTPQGVEAQQQMVDITTNNYQKALEEFFSRYCSYALTIYFQELKGTTWVTPTADARKDLINEGVPPEAFIHEAYVEKVEKEDGTFERVSHPADGTGLKDGQLQANFAEMATTYYVQCVPGSLVELEDEKQIRLLNDMFIPLSQALPAIAKAGNPNVLKQASDAMMFIIQKQIELSGSAHSTDVIKLLNGETDEVHAAEKRMERVELALGGSHTELVESTEALANVVEAQQEQMAVLRQGMTALLAAQGIPAPGGQSDGSAPQGTGMQALPPAPTPA